MDTYDNEYMEWETPQKVRAAKVSPFADSPYECAVPQPERPVKPRKTRRVRRISGWGVLLIVVLILAACGGTALGVGAYWQSRMDIMEEAMDNKFHALEEIYRETVLGAGESTVPAEGMTPGQVYAANVQAVVAINSIYETQKGYSESFGSGFIITTDGYVVTNCHVVDGATEVYVVTHDENSYPATIVGSDATNDIALLKVEAQALPCVTVGSSDALQVGDQVAAIGNPLGELTSTLTVGYISAKDRVVSTDGSVINMLQTDAAINSGNSGGPLFNMRGQVIGITTAKYSGSSTTGASIEGLGFAIPMDDVMGMFEDLMEYGYITGAYLGVYVRDVDSTAQTYGLPAGAYVEEPMAGMAADKAGILAGDIIVNLGGYDVDSVTELTRVLRRFEAGDTTTVTVYRNGKSVFLKITLDEKPVEVDTEPTEPETTEPTLDPSKMPESGTFEEWYEFFAPFFGWD